MSSSTQPGGIYPDSISNDPLSEPKPSTRQDLPPNNNVSIMEHEKKTNPTKHSDNPSVSTGTASVNEDQGGGEEKKSMGDKIKDKLSGN